MILIECLLNMGWKRDLSETVKFCIVYLHKEGKTQLFTAKEMKSSQISEVTNLRDYCNNKYRQNKYFKSG